MHNLSRLFIISLVTYFCVSSCTCAAQTNQTIPIRVTVDPQSHSVLYKVGKYERSALDGARLSTQLQAAGSDSAGSSIVFLIDNGVPILELDTILLIVDKYDLASVRFFVCSQRTSQMTELKRNAEGLLYWTSHTLALSDTPPKE
jgi:hypothetical protein